MDDREILAALTARNETAITALDAAYGRLCRSIARNILGSDEDAEECVNDTWLKIWASVPPDEPRSLTAYAGTITRRLAINRWHANHADCRQTEASIPLDELDAILHGSDEISARIDRAELIDLLNTFLAGLDRQTRVVFVRRYWNMDTLADISARLGLREGTVRVKLHRARQKLRKELERRDLL